LLFLLLVSFRPHVFAVLQTAILVVRNLKLDREAHEHHSSQLCHDGEDDSRTPCDSLFLILLRRNLLDFEVVGLTCEELKVHYANLLAFLQRRKAVVLGLFIPSELAACHQLIAFDRAVGELFRLQIEFVLLDELLLGARSCDRMCDNVQSLTDPTKGLI